MDSESNQKARGKRLSGMDTVTSTQLICKIDLREWQEEQEFVACHSTVLAPPLLVTGISEAINCPWGSGIVVRNAG